MAVALVPYRWVTDNGMPHWALPGAVTSAIDLRPLPLHADTKSVGYAVAVLDGELPEGAVELETGNETRDRNAWRSTLGYRPAGSNAAQWAFSHLAGDGDSGGADDSGDAACRPLRCARPDKLELHLGGKHERQTTAIERLKQAVLIRADLGRMVDDDTIPRLMLGKFLQAEADRMGIDATTLRGNSAKLRGIRPEKPETTITDPFYDAAPFIFLSAYTPPGAAGPWTTAGSNGSRFQTGNAGDGLGSKVVFDGSGFVSATTWAYHPTSLSSANAYAQLEGMPRQNSPTLGPMVRSNGSTSNYFADVYFGRNRCYVWVSGTPTLISEPNAAAGSVDTPWIRAIGSTITWGHVVGTTIATATNTAVSTGPRTGILGDDAVGDAKAATGFYARDFLTLSVTGVTPSSGSTAGGTAITITGTGFLEDATVGMGSPATSVVYVNDTTLTAVTPARPAGAQDVNVSQDGGLFSSSLILGFTFTAPSARGRRIRLLKSTVPWLR
jgi:hypothetical protein